MGKTKLETLRDFDGEIRGYKLGQYYLMKRYYYNNTFSWLVCKEDRNTWGFNLGDLINKGEVIPALTFKRGKALLIKLYNESK